MSHIFIFQGAHAPPVLSVRVTVDTGLGGMSDASPTSVLWGDDGGNQVFAWGAWDRSDGSGSEILCDQPVTGGGLEGGEPWLDVELLMDVPLPLAPLALIPLGSGGGAADTHGGGACASLAGRMDDEVQDERVLGSGCTHASSRSPSASQEDELCPPSPYSPRGGSGGSEGSAADSAVAWIAASPLAGQESVAHLRLGCESQRRPCSIEGAGSRHTLQPVLRMAATGAAVPATRSTITYRFRCSGKDSMAADRSTLREVTVHDGSISISVSNGHR